MKNNYSGSFYNPHKKNSIIWFRKSNEKMENFGNAVEIDYDNNIIAAGSLFDGNTYNFKTVKYDENGKLLLNKTYESEKQDIAYDITTDSNNNIIVVGFSGMWNPDPLPNASAFILKYDKNGTLLWNKSFKKGICTMGFGITTDSKDNIYFTSTFFITGQPNLGCWTIKCDKNGKMIFDKIFHEHYMDIPYSITTDSNNNAIIVGYAYTPYKKPYKPNSPWTAGFLSLKYDENGNLLWKKRYESRVTSEAFDVSIDSNDNIIIVGQRLGHPVTIKANKHGKILWREIYKNKKYVAPYGVDVNSKDYIIVGNTYYGSKKPESIIITYKTNGEVKTTKKSKTNKTLFDIAVDHQDNIISVGTYIKNKDNFYLLKEKIE